VVSLALSTSVETPRHRYRLDLAVQLRNAHTASWVVAGRLSSTHHLIWLASLTLSVLAALAWAWLFFNPHALIASGVALVFATLFAVPLLVISFNASLALGIAFVPYQLWLVLATSLAFGYSAQ